MKVPQLLEGAPRRELVVEGSLETRKQVTGVTDTPVLANVNEFVGYMALLVHHRPMTQAIGDRAYRKITESCK